MIVSNYLENAQYFWYAGNGNIGVVVTESSNLHLALNQPNLNWLKIPFSPLVSAQAAQLLEPAGKTLMKELICST